MECERANPAEPLRQGDIIAAQPDSDAWRNPWTRFGVILTADCDIAQNKTGPNVVYVPVVSHCAYISDTWVPTIAESLANEGRQKLDKYLAGLDAKLATRHIAAWADRGGDENIVSQLDQQLASRTVGLQEALDPQRIINLWHAVAGLTALSQRPSVTQVGDIRDVLDQLVISGSLVSPAMFSDAAARQRTIESALASLEDRLDTCLIRELIGLDTDMQEPSTYGYVVPLRAFAALPIERLEIDRGSWYRRKENYLRICRLRGIYKSDLVQKFANLFMRVGLDDERVEAHRRAFKRSAQSLFPEGIQ